MSFLLRRRAAFATLLVAPLGCGARTGSLDNSAGPDAGISPMDASVGDTGATHANAKGPLWPMMGGSPARAGRRAHGADAAASAEWTAPLALVEGVPGDEWTAIAIAADGTAYFGDGTGLHARAPDGTARWTFTPPLGGCLGSPAIADDGTIYVGCSSSALALTPDGKTKWSVELGALITEAPALAADGTVYFGPSGGRLHALTSAGVERWSATLGGLGLHSSPAVGPSGTIYVLVWKSDAQSLAAVRPTGELAWTAPLDFSIEARAPVVADDETVYVSGVDVLIAFAADGTKKWSSAVHTNGPPAIDVDGTIYVSGNGFGANVHALFPDGTEKWKATTAVESGTTSPIIGADGVIYVLDQKVHAFRADGVLLGERATDSLAIGPASIAGKTVYFADVHGTLHAMHAP